MSQFDAYPHWSSEALLVFFMTPDLTKSYRQIFWSPPGKKQPSPPVQFVPICCISLRLVWSPSYFPAIAYANAYLDEVTIHIGTWAKHVDWVTAALEYLSAHGQPEEVCDCTERGTVSGLPLGKQAGVSTDPEN